MSLTETRADRAATWNPVLAPRIVTATTVLLLLALVRVSASSPVVGVVAVGAAALLAVVSWFGLERTGSGVVVVAMVLAPLNDVRPVASLSFVTASDAVFLLGFGLLAPTLLRRPFQPPGTLVAGALVLVGAGLVASAAAPAPMESFNPMLRLVVGAFGLPVLFMWWRPSSRLVVALAWAYVLGNLVSTAMGVIDGAIYGGRYLGGATHPNVFGLTEMLALAVLPWLATKLPRHHWWLPAAAAAGCFYGVWISGSRAALLLVIVVALLLPVLTRSVAAGLALAMAGTVVLAFSGRFLGEESDNALGRLFGGGSAQGSDLERESVAQKALDVFLESPVLGSGFGNVLEAHNIYLQSLAAVGVVGTAGYLLVLWSVARPVFTVPHPTHLLALPALAYVMIGMITPLMWDRFIWSLLSLAFLAPFLDRATPPDGTTSRPLTAQEAP